MTDTYPKQMRHPAEQPSRCIRQPRTNDRLDPGEWTQASYMPVFVQNADQEEEYRAKGYLGPGEGAAKMQVFQEYPKMLHHPAYVPEVPQQIDAKLENGRVVSVTIPGRPAVNPPVTVNSPDEEAEWIARGYGAPKVGDAAAFSMAVNAPHRPSGYDPKRYPMMVGDRLVHNEAEEAAARGEAPPRGDPAGDTAHSAAEVAGIAAQLADMQRQIAALAAENAELKGKKAATREKRAAGLAKARKAKAEKSAGDNANATQ